MGDLTTIGTMTMVSFRTFKRYQDTYWVNTYEATIATDSPPADSYAYLKSLADDFANAEIAIHHGAVTLDRVVVSTVEPDSVPYNPSAFVVFTYNQSCSGINSNYTMLPLTICVLVKRVVHSGRAGNLLYRGALATTSGSMTPRGFLLDNDDQNRVQTALNTLINNIQSKQALITMIKMNQSGVVEDVRTVFDFSVRRLTTTKKLRNRYFDVQR